MVDAHSAHQSLAEPAGYLGVAGVEHGAIVLPQPGQRGDRKEAAITAEPASPAHQPGVLAVVDLRARSLPGAGGDGQRKVAEAQHVGVDLQVGDVVVGTQYREHNSAVL